ncbi:MAG: inositol phosphate phosphatase SopB [Gammaproteobacteria bacterium]
MPYPQILQRSSLIPANVYLKPPSDGGCLVGRQVRPALAAAPRAANQIFFEKAKSLLSRALDAMAPDGLRADSKIRHAREDVGKALSQLLDVFKTNRHGKLDKIAATAPVDKYVQRFREACAPFIRLGKDLNRELVSQLSAQMSRLSVEEQSAVRESLLNSGDGDLQAVIQTITGSDFEWDLTTLRATDPGSHQRLMDAFTRLDDSANLLGQAPAAHDELTSHLIELEQAGVALSQKADDLNRLKPVASEKAQRLTDVLVSALQALKGDLQTRQTSLRTMHDANPTSLRDIYHAKSQHLSAAINVLADQIKRHPNLDHDARSKLVGALNTLINRKEYFRAESAKPQAAATPPEDKMKELLGDREEKRMADLLEKAFKAAGLNDAAKHVAHDLHRQHVEVLNSQPWDTIAKSATFTHNGRLQAYRSTIQPGPQLLTSYAGKGVCCHTTWEKQHAVNLARSELKDANGDTLFAGFRHGVHSAYGIEDAAERAKANVNRAKETLAAIIASDPQGSPPPRTAKPSPSGWRRFPC